MNFKKLAAFSLAALLAAAPAFPAFTTAVYADEAADLAAVNASIDNLEQQKESLLGSIDDLKQKLVTTISQLDSVNNDITELQGKMEKTQSDLEQAQAEQTTEYNAMKKRIQYLYETGGEVGGWAAVFLSGGNISDILNKAEYTQQMYDYDRQQLEDYVNTVNQVTSLQQQQQDQKAQLESSKNSLTEGQQTLEGLISEAQGKYDDFDAELAEAYQLADQYQQLIVEQNKAIAQKAAADAAAQQAATASEDTSANYMAAIGNAADTTYGTDNTGADNSYAYTGTYSAADNAAAGGTSYAGTSSGNTGTVSGNATSSLGQQILSYASQYVGGKYVWGGNDLNTGVDCSGFVQQVYKNFGINTSRTSYDIETDGQAVSYSDVQVGDVLCYDGHVGIYAGDGKIINAIDDAHGIGYSDANYSEIRSIRRYS